MYSYFWKEGLELEDADYMHLAVVEAQKAQGMTWTNPLVGAVIVRQNQVLATGYHHQYGQEHAEVNALSNLAGESPRGATLYVTLEPCSHYGKQPPCCRRVVEAGIKRVVIGQVDPHKVVAGKGVQYLQEHGVQVTNLGGVQALYRKYNFYYEHERPYVTVKYAMSLDGKINGAEHKRTFLTGSEAQIDVQKLRCQNQAILIGANTLKIDDPQLTVRLRALPFPPIKVVVTHDANKINWRARLFSGSGPVWVLSTKDCTSVPSNVQVFTAVKWTSTKITQLLGEHEIQALLVEGGSQIQAEFFASGLVDEVVTYLAPQVLGGTALPAAVGPALIDKLQYELACVEQLGQDVRICARRK